MPVVLKVAQIHLLTAKPVIRIDPKLACLLGSHMVLCQQIVSDVVS